MKSAKLQHVRGHNRIKCPYWLHKSASVPQLKLWSSLISITSYIFLWRSHQLLSPHSSYHTTHAFFTFLSRDFLLFLFASHPSLPSSPFIYFAFPSWVSCVSGLTEIFCTCTICSCGRAGVWCWPEMRDGDAWISNTWGGKEEVHWQQWWCCCFLPSCNYDAVF